MRLLQVQGPQDMPLVAAPRPVPGAGEVLIAVAYCGICGSDFPRYFDGAVHAFPQTLGHEFSGVVAETGPGVTGVAVGRRVVVAPLVPCHRCPRCQAGRPALCAQYSFIGSRRQGALAEFVTAPARNLVPLPAAVSLRDGALVEPLTVALHALGQVPLVAGATAAVFGVGVIGLLTVAALKAQGAGRVVAVDTHPDKLALAAELGADDLVLGSEVDSFFAQTAAPQLSVETAGHPITQAQAVAHTGPAGQVVFVGTCTRDVTFRADQFERILRGELSLHGSWMSYSDPFPGREWTAAVDLMAQTPALSALVSQVYSLEDGPRPFLDIQRAGGGRLKALYRIAPEPTARP
ncbi:MAG: galactitol-1-phosphate 5-dehydrogenase [Propionibacteriaceae bacterium]|nr:galactitol-1-phosphate 5-dehydrogenase [Propionibacteriaceae bacterium]